MQEATKKPRLWSFFCGANVTAGGDAGLRWEPGRVEFSVELCFGLFIGQLDVLGAQDTFSPSVCSFGLWPRVWFGGDWSSPESFSGPQYAPWI